MSSQNEHVIVYETPEVVDYGPIADSTFRVQLPNGSGGKPDF